PGGPVSAGSQQDMLIMIIPMTDDRMTFFSNFIFEAPFHSLLRIKAPLDGAGIGFGRGRKPSPDQAADEL
ncbi:MAG: hypothetical protein JXD23_14960, partial [Spirochaetales bacterium]|nr:hypothetical protein [Spirochaetales bacterium]